jgi:hypothetical protein
MVEITVKVPFVDEIAAHVKKHKTAYIVGTTVVVTAGITYFVTRRISVGQGNVNVRALNLLSNKPNIVTVIENGRQGPPSWVVRCVETNEWFSSQRAAAFGKGLSESELSSHLNGLRDNVRDLHFERVCLAA